MKVFFPSRTTFLKENRRRLKDGGTAEAAEPGVYDRITEDETTNLTYHAHCPQPSTSALRRPQPPDHREQSVGTAPRLVRAYGHGVGAV